MMTSQHSQTLSNCPFEVRKVPPEKLDNLDEYALNDNQETSNQGTPAMDDVEPQQSRKRVFGTPPFSARSHSKETI